MKHRNREGSWNRTLRELVEGGYVKGHRMVQGKIDIVDVPEEGRQSMRSLIESGIATLAIGTGEDDRTLGETRIAMSEPVGAVIEFAARIAHAVEPDRQAPTFVPNNDPIRAVRLGKRTWERMARVGESTVWGHRITDNWYIELEGAGQGVPDAIGVWRSSAKKEETEVYTGIWEAAKRRPNRVIATLRRNPEEEEAQAKASAVAVTAHGQVTALGADAGSSYIETLTQDAGRIAATVIGIAATSAPRMATVDSQDREVRREHGNMSVVYRRMSNRLRTRPVIRFTGFETGWPGRSRANEAGSGLDAITRAAMHSAKLHRHNFNRGERGRVTLPDRILEGAAAWLLEQEGARHRGESIVQAMEEVVRIIMCAIATIDPGRNRGEPEMQALAVPTKLWEAIGEAGIPPLEEDPFEGGRDAQGRMWFVEIEKPRRDDPRAVVLYRIKGNEAVVQSVLGIWTKPPYANEEGPFVAVHHAMTGSSGYSAGRIGERLSVDGDETIQALGGTAAKSLMRADGPATRALGAVHEHLIRGQGATLSTTPAMRVVWEQTDPGDGYQGEKGSASGPEPGIFAMVRSPEPERRTAVHGGDEGQAARRAGHAARAPPGRGPLEAAGVRRRQAQAQGDTRRVLPARAESGRGPDRDDEAGTGASPGARGREDGEVKEHAISELGAYNARLRRGLADKLYFADKTEARTVVDYGCADGTVLRALVELAPDLEVLGYDENDEMIAQAKAAAPQGTWTASWNKALRWKEARRGPTALVLSSVIHEVHSYENERGVRRFWERVFESGFDYVAIRDMVPGRGIDRAADPSQVAKVRQRSEPALLGEWERRWGTIDAQRSLVHYLLTVPYTDNWERELNEDYLPVSMEELLERIPRGYEPSHIEHFTLGYVRERIKREFDIEMSERTHLKLIVKRKGGCG